MSTRFRHHILRRLAAVLLMLLPVAAGAQPMPPPLPPALDWTTDGVSSPDSTPWPATAVPQLLGAWSFDQPASLAGYRGDAPILSSNLFLVPSPWGYAVRLSPDLPSCLRLGVRQANTNGDFSVRNGTVSLWMRPDWSPGGSDAPAAATPLVEVGSSTLARTGWWAWLVNPGGHEVQFVGQARGQEVTWLRAPVSFRSNEWMHLALTWSPTNSALYVNGVRILTGAGVSHWPALAERSSGGWGLGGEATGQRRLRADFDLLMTANHPVPAAGIAGQFASAVASQGSADTSVGALAALAGASEFGAPSLPATFRSGLWIEGGLGAVTGSPGGWLRGTTAGVRYEIFAAGAMAGPWSLDQSLVGAAGRNWTAFSLASPDIPTGFVVASPYSDADADGLSDEFERRVSRTRIASADSDDDGMPDGWEVEHGLDPNRADGHEDPDGDGIVSALEHLHGRDPGVRDPLPLVSVSATTTTLREGQSTGRFILRRTAPLTDALQVGLDWTGASVNGSDYALLLPQVTFPAGASEVSLTVNPLVDGLDEKDEPVILTLQRGLFYGRNTTHSARMTIQDADRPLVFLDVVDPEATEPDLRGSDLARIEVRRSGLTEEALVVPIRRAATSGAVSGTDYTALPASVTIPAGETRAMLNIVPINNRRPTGDLLLVVEIVPAVSTSPYTVKAGQGVASILIRDVELPTVTVQAEVAMAEERGAKPGRFRFQRTESSTEPLTVFYAVGGTAAPGTAGYTDRPGDYRSLPGFVIIPAGSASATVDVVPIVDAELESLETVKVILTGSREYSIGQGNAATVTLDDQNTARWRSELLQPNSVAGADGPAGLIRITRLGTVLTDMTVPYQVLGQRTLLPSGAVYQFGQPLPPGTPASYQMTVSGGRLGTTAGTLLLPKGIVTMDVGLKATLTSKEVAGATLRLANGAPTEVSHPVVFLDRWHLVTLERTDQRVSEGARPVVRLTAAAQDPAGSQSTTVRLNISGSAILDSDFTLAGINGTVLSNPDGSRSVDVVIPAKPTSGTIRSATLTITATSDGRAEAQVETLVIRHEPGQISSAHHAVINPLAYASVQIRDNTAIAFPALDCDADGFPDTYELDHDHDPLTPTVVLADEDRDGVLDLPELLRGTKYDDADTDKDGVNDFLEGLVGSNPLVADAGLAMATRDHVPVRLVTAGTLRAAEGACFHCHAPGMAFGGVEQLAHLRPPDSGSLMLSRNLLLAPGTTHEISLTQPPGYVANRTTPSTYTAQIEPLDPTRPPGFIVLETDATKPLLGVNRPVDTATLSTRRASLRVLNRPKLAVDANRDGVIRFDASDATSSKRPYRFWVNNDRDAGTDPEAPEILGSTVEDHQNGTIDNIRDLEDFSRIWVDTVGLQRELSTAGVKFAFEWRQVTEGAPAIQIYRSSDAAGGLGYLTTRSTAVGQVLPNPIQTGFAHAMTAEGSTTRRIESGSRFVMPYSSWNRTANQQYFIFEAAGLGKGQLVFQLLLGDKVLVESEPLHLEFLDVRQMYRRVRATPRDGFTQPYVYAIDQPPRILAGIEGWDDGYPLALPPEPDGGQVVFVHGWNMTPDETKSFSATMYKRLWHAGYRGQFTTFRWPTHWLNKVEWTDLDLFDSYNFSEHRAWVYGASLKKLLGSLEVEGRQTVICHSLGATVLTSALKLGANPQASIFMQAAVPASVYDTNPTLVESVLTDAEQGNRYWSVTPNLFSLQGGYGGLISSSVNGAKLFYNESDYALQTGKVVGGLGDVHWVANQRARPSLPVGFSYHGYAWIPGTMDVPAYGVRKPFEFIPKRPVLDPLEVLAFVSRSRTRALGAEGRVGGVLNIDRSVNLVSVNFGPSRSDHSGQFNRSIQEVFSLFQNFEEDLAR